MKKDIFDVAVNRGFFFPSFEPYGSVSGFYDYGPLGLKIKNKIIGIWREMFLSSPEILEIETTVVNIEKMLIASGHVENFTDPLIRCNNCNEEYRADKLIEEKTKKKTEGLRADELQELIEKENIKCPKCKNSLSSITKFNLMFELQIGATGKVKGFLRPETAQGLFVAFPRVFKTFGNKLPIGIAQVGKSFRNEIAPRKGLTRMREFTQMEIEYFFDPEKAIIDGYDKVKNTEISMMTNEAQGKSLTTPVKGSVDAFLKSGNIPNQIMAYFIAMEQKFYERLGIPSQEFWFRELLPDETPHYSGGNVDMEVRIGDEIIETIGNAYRTDYDLKRHMEVSKEDMRVFIDEKKIKIIPHVVEPSIGFDRSFYVVLYHSYREKGNGKDWSWFDFPFEICPYQVAVFPLMKKDSLDVKALEIYYEIRKHFDAYYSDRGHIGKRYARADEIGTYLAVTIDYQTLEDNTVTIRHRNTSKQKRVEKKELIKEILNLSTKKDI